MRSARDIHAMCLRDFIYTPDGDQFQMREHWTSHEDAVMAGDVWRDDCDGFALTAAVLALEYGHAPQDIALAYVRTETGGGHLVCTLGNRVIDNRFRSDVAMGFPRYEWVKGMKLSDKVWKEYN